MVGHNLEEILKLLKRRAQNPAPPFAIKGIVVKHVPHQHDGSEDVLYASDFDDPEKFVMVSHGAYNEYAFTSVVMRNGVYKPTDERIRLVHRHRGSWPKFEVKDGYVEGKPLLYERKAALVRMLPLYDDKDPAHYPPHENLLK